MARAVPKLLYNYSNYILPYIRKSSIYHLKNEAVRLRGAAVAKPLSASRPHHPETSIFNLKRVYNSLAENKEQFCK
jgi:hypothetical protein